MQINQEQLGVVLFKVADRDLAIPTKHVREILALPALIDEPGAPELMAGFLNIAGEIIPVIRLELLFDWPLEPLNYNSQLIVVKSDGHSHALAVQKVYEVKQVSDIDLKAAEEGNTVNECVTNNLQLGEKSIPVLNIEKLLLKEEAEKIAELKELHQQRINKVSEKESE